MLCLIYKNMTGLFDLFDCSSVLVSTDTCCVDHFVK